MSARERVPYTHKEREDIFVSLASKGIRPNGECLPPEMWEALRAELQRTYRHVTGEMDAVLSLTAAGYRIVPPGGLDAETVERCAQEVIAYKRDASFDDSMVGALEHNSNQWNIATALRSLIEAPDAIAQRNGGKG